MNFSYTLFITSVLLFAAANGLQCGNYICGGDNSCCSDALLGPTCYDPLDNVCAANGLGTFTLCGNAEEACGNICFETEDYFCCNGNLNQKSQACATSSPTTVSQTTASPTTAAPVYNCPGASNAYGVNCASGTTCCGSGTITPTCIDNSDTSVKCCTYFLSSTQCPADATCGGILGPGASSDAQCGFPGSTFCDAGFGLNAFCAPDQLCVTTDGTATCVSNGQTVSPTTSPTATVYSCPGATSDYGVNCPAGTYCCGSGTITPKCIDNSDTAVKCCTYFLSATQCPADATCGGILGPGASSNAQCGPANSTFCDAGFGYNAFCSANQVCSTTGGVASCLSR